MLYLLSLSWNGEQKLQNLYSSLLPSLKEIELNWRWFIKENGSSDQSLDIIKNWKNEQIITIAYPNNKQNYSQGNNYLFNQANPGDDDLILLLNNDIIFNDQKSIKNMLDIILNDSKVGIVGAKLNYTNKKTILQHSGVVWHRNGLHTPINFRAGKKEEERDRINRYVPMTTGACLLTRANIYRQVAGLDEKYFFCWEDCDFCLKVKELGYEIVLCGQTDILHEESASLKKNPIDKLFFSSNTKIFMERWRHKIDLEETEKYEENSQHKIYKLI